jgi:hypothetical protein
MAASCQTRAAAAAHNILIFGLWIGSVLAYIPAHATNRTNLLPVTRSSIQLEWSSGSYDVPVSFQLAGSGSMGYSRVSTSPVFIDFLSMTTVVGCNRSL